jgi:hypothetical protein
MSSAIRIHLRVDLVGCAAVCGADKSLAGLYAVAVK